jgi:hypothetical protein
MRNLNKAFNYILRAIDNVLGAILDAIRAGRPSQRHRVAPTIQEEEQTAQLIEKALARSAEHPAYTRQQWHDEFVKPYQAPRPELRKKQKKNSFHP